MVDVGCGMWDVGGGMWEVGCGMFDVGGGMFGKKKTGQPVLGFARFFGVGYWVGLGKNLR